MLRWAVSEEKKDWNKLVPILLFVYPGLHRILPFELLYHPVRGPLDILRECGK